MWGILTLFCGLQNHLNTPPPPPWHWYKWIDYKWCTICTFICERFHEFFKLSEHIQERCDHWSLCTLIALSLMRTTCHNNFVAVRTGKGIPFWQIPMHWSQLSHLYFGFLSLPLLFFNKDLTSFLSINTFILLLPTLSLNNFSSDFGHFLQPYDVVLNGPPETSFAGYVKQFMLQIYSGTASQYFHHYVNDCFLHLYQTNQFYQHCHQFPSCPRLHMDCF